MPRVLRSLVAAMLVLPLLFAVVTAPAMAGSTQTGTIRGRVIDDKGQAVPGATVLMRSEALIRERATVTDADGGYFASGLPMGKYQVIAQMAGYTTVAAVTEVQLDKTTVVNLSMKEGDIVETVTVVSTKPVVSKTATDGAKVVDKKQTDNLPVGRTYQSLIQFAPGVTGGSNPNMLGGTSNSNVYLADGVSVRDPVTGTFGSNMIFDAIEAVDVKLTGVSAEYGEFQGGLTNMITKSGSNSFTGSLRDVITQPNWRIKWTHESENLFPQSSGGTGTYALVRGVYVPRDWTYARPSVPSKTDQFADGATKTSNRIQTTLGGPIVTDRAWFFLAYDRNFSTGTASTNSGAYNNFFNGDYAIVKGTWQATNDHRFQYFYSRDPARTTRDYAFLFWGGGAYDERSIDVQEQGGHLWTASWNAVWGPSIVSDFKMAKFGNSFAIEPYAPPANFGQPLGRANTVGPAIENSTGIIYDTNIFSPDPEVRLRDQYEGALTYFFDTKKIGTHTIKVGLDYHTQENIGASIIQGNALFYFDNACEGIGAPADNLECRHYTSWTDFALPSKSGPKNKLTTMFVQDDWQLNQKLSFNLGVRYEKNDNENDVGEKVISSNYFTPRLGVSFDITGAGKHVVKGTYAQYAAGINLTTLSPFVRAAGGQSSYNLWANAAPGTATPVWVLQGVVSPDAEAASFDPNIKPQKINEWTLAYEFGVSPDLGFGIQYVDRKWDDITTVKYRYDYAVDVIPAESGIPADDDVFVTPRKLQRISNNSDAKRSYKAFILRADKHFTNNWSVSASWTRSKAEGNVTSDSGLDTFAAYPGVPQATANRYGYLAWDATNQAKLQAYYKIPLKSERHAVSIGTNINYSSGYPYAKNIATDWVVTGPGCDPNPDTATHECQFILNKPLGTVVAAGDGADQKEQVPTFYEPRGSHRMPSNRTMDLSFNYAYQVNAKMRVELRAEVFNIFNEQFVTAVSSSWYNHVDPGAPGLLYTQARTNYQFGFPTSHSAGVSLGRNWNYQVALVW